MTSDGAITSRVRVFLSLFWYFCEFFYLLPRVKEQRKVTLFAVRSTTFAGRPRTGFYINGLNYGKLIRNVCQVHGKRTWI